MTDRTLLAQALDALEAALSDDQPYIERGKAAITALRSALAAPQPEPVAYVPRCHTDGNYCIVGEYKWDEIEEKPFGLADPAHWECAALYAAPPAAPAPADWGTPHDVSGAPWDVPAPAVVACKGIPRKGCNYLTPADTVCNKCGEIHHHHQMLAHFYAESAAPAVREPLTNEQIRELAWPAFYRDDERFLPFARAIEQAHGIGGGGNG